MIRVFSDTDGALVLYAEDRTLTVVRKRGAIRVEVADLEEVRKRYTSVVERKALEEAIPEESARKDVVIALERAYDDVREALR